MGPQSLEVFLSPNTRASHLSEGLPGLMVGCEKLGPRGLLHCWKLRASGGP